MKFPFLLGRLMFGGFFLKAGIHHIQERESMAQYAAAKNVPMPELAVTATGVALTIGGASILLGVKPKVGALAIAGFLARRLAHYARLLECRRSQSAAE
jgi:putative oxidoreductase